MTAHVTEMANVPCHGSQSNIALEQDVALKEYINVPLHGGCVERIQTAKVTSHKPRPDINLETLRLQLTVPPAQLRHRGIEAIVFLQEAYELLLRDPVIPVRVGGVPGVVHQ